MIIRLGFLEVRKTAPIAWIEQPDDKSGGFRDGGYWAVTKHADVKEISRLDEVFSSEVNGAVPRFNDDVERADIEVNRVIMLNQDAPHHTRLRRIISRGFTTTDYELSGVQIKKGPRVVMLYRSANFDEEVFADPFTFDILRDPNPHVGFGGTGAHYCIGTHLARMTIQLQSAAIADHMPDLLPLAEPERLQSGWLNGIKHWQVDHTGNPRQATGASNSVSN